MSGDSDQQFREISACLIIGKDLFNELNKKSLCATKTTPKLSVQEVVHMLRDLQ